jgi:peptidoglycan/LPS O-acetylase OafA/YrhL
LATTTLEPAAHEPKAAEPGWFRGDVDGIRAIAILLVVAYHTGLPHLHGGFVGVDVFFVISGFLITRNLLRERERTGRIALGRFWARRIRRLVPALALVVAVTLVASYFIVPLYQLGDVAKQGAAASLYVSNVLFASQARNYFTTDISFSPFLHTWSLGVEEQFYLVWPVLFALATWAVVGRRRRTSTVERRSLLIAVFGVVFAVSMALNLALTGDGNSWAFFGLPSRAWEFAVAGLLAALPVPRLLRGVAARTVLAGVGLLLLLAALKLLDDATPYPGLWALLPVSATVLLIVAGETWAGTVEAGPVSRGLSVAPMQWLGRVSYSWYLWHWPAIVLLTIAVGRDRTAYKLAAALVALPVAWVAYRWFETPLRFTPRIARSSVRTFAFGAVVTVLVVALAWVVQPETLKRHRGDVLTAADFEAPAGSSLQERVKVTVDELHARSDESCPKDGLQSPDGDEYCVGGDLNGTRSLLLLGDSHAGQWRRTLDQIARARHLKLYIRQHNGCPPYPVNIIDPLRGDRKTALCLTNQLGDVRLLDALHPDAVLLAVWSGNRDHLVDESGDKVPKAQQVASWEAGVRSMTGDLRRRGIPYGMILDEPTLPINAVDCIARLNQIAACERTRADALEASEPLLDVERKVMAETPSAPTLDMTAALCDADRCRLEVDGHLVYADSHHLTDAFAIYAQPLVEPIVTALLP